MERVRVRLDRELKEYNSSPTMAEFREKIEAVLHLLFPEETTERVICSWRMSRDFSRAVCRSLRLPCNEKTEFLVAWGLINMRKAKRGNLHLYERRSPPPGGLNSGEARPPTSPPGGLNSGESPHWSLGLYVLIL